MDLMATPSMGYPLRLTATNAHLSYQLYEVSACTLGILSKDLLTLKDYLVMELGGRRIPLRVAEILPPIRPQLGPVIRRYRLACLDCLMELDRLLGASSPVEPGRSLQFPRCLVNPRLYVEANWPGRERVELFESVDISRTGLLLRIVKNSESLLMLGQGSIPLRVDVARLWLPEIVQAQAQIVRSYQSHEEFKTFSYMAVRLTDFHSREGDDWQKLLRRLERGFLPGLARVA